MIADRHACACGALLRLPFPPRWVTCSGCGRAYRLAVTVQVYEPGTVRWDGPVGRPVEVGA